MACKRLALLSDLCILSISESPPPHIPIPIQRIQMPIVTETLTGITRLTCSSNEMTWFMVCGSVRFLVIIG